MLVLRRSAKEEALKIERNKQGLSQLMGGLAPLIMLALEVEFAILD
jgi:hypothetical protein